MDFGQATLFNNRNLALVTRIVSSSTSVKENFINDQERQIFKRAHLIKQLNIDLDHQLVKILTDSKDFVLIIDAVKFLLNCQKRSLLEYGQEILIAAKENQKFMDEQALKDTLKHTVKFGGTLSVSLLGKDSVGFSEKEKPLELPKNFDLDSFRDFR